MKSQKESLIEDFKLIKGTRPVTNEERVMIGEIEGVQLRGYAWWGDMIYLKLPNSNKFLILSKVESAPGQFDEAFSEILESFRFN